MTVQANTTPTPNLHTVEHLAKRAADQIDDLARQAADRAREATEHARERAVAATDLAVGHVRDEPVKSLLIAAAAGAAAAALVGYLVRSRTPVRD